MRANSFCPAGVHRLTALALAAALLGLALPPAAVHAAEASPAASTQPARRLALVIGNNAYKDSPLLNPVNDANAMARALRAAGFEVILRTDASQRQMLDALREFGNRLKGSDAGLFYYAGHGMQIKGRNFLIPVGADIEGEDEVAYAALDAQAVLDKMESAGNGTNLMILDACRNNPFARSFRSATQGLAQMDAPVGTMVAFSTAPGSVASDGAGSNGLYTQHLLGALAQPGLRVEQVFKQVRAAVRRESQGRQVPWESTSLEGDFYFVAPAPVAALPAPDPLRALDDALWETVSDSGQGPELQAYLRRFPQGRHAEAARARLAALAPTLMAAAAPAPALAPALAPEPARTPAPAALPADAASLAVAAIAPAVPAAAALLAAPLATPPGTPPDPQPEPLSPVAELLPADHEVAQRQIAEIVRWGDLGTERRPAQPRRITPGFTEGDRYRWRIEDRMRNEFAGDVLMRIDRVDDDGTMQVNDGTIRLDRTGNVTYRSDGPKAIVELWDPPLPVAEAALRGAGHQRDVEGTRMVRRASGAAAPLRFSGSLRVVGSETVSVPAGRFTAVRVEVQASAFVRSDDVSHPLNWRLTYWYAPTLGLPIAFEIEERSERLERWHRHELTAYDVDGASTRMAELDGRPAPR